MHVLSATKSKAAALASARVIFSLWSPKIPRKPAPASPPVCLCRTDVPHHESHPSTVGPLRISLLLKEANNISQKLNKHIVFSHHDNEADSCTIRYVVVLSRFAESFILKYLRIISKKKPRVSNRSCVKVIVDAPPPFEISLAKFFGKPWFRFKSRISFSLGFSKLFCPRVT